MVRARAVRGRVGGRRRWARCGTGCAAGGRVARLSPVPPALDPLFPIDCARDSLGDVRAFGPPLTGAVRKRRRAPAYALSVLSSWACHVGSRRRRALRTGCAFPSAVKISAFFSSCSPSPLPYPPPARSSLAPLRKRSAAHLAVASPHRCGSCCADLCGGVGHGVRDLASAAECLLAVAFLGWFLGLGQPRIRVALVAGAGKILRFKLCILAGDDTGNADFILFGRQAQRLTRKAVDTLIAENPIGFIPDELTRLLERTFTWTVSFTDSTTDLGSITFQVNTVVGEVTQEGVVLPATPAGSQASSIMLSPGASTNTNTLLPVASEASFGSTATPTKPTLPAFEIPDSPQSVKKNIDHQKKSLAVGDDSSQKFASNKRSCPSPSKKITKKLFTAEEAEDDVGGSKDGGAAGQDRNIKKNFAISSFASLFVSFFLHLNYKR